MAQVQEVPLTEIGAVNVMLSTIGETPVSSVDNITSVDVEIAYTILINTSRQVQEIGLHCNTEKSYRISPNNDGEIVLPANTLECDEIIPQGDYQRDLAVRGSKLYDRINHTYAINEAVEVDLVKMLTFEELPSVVRSYVTIYSARIFADRMLGDEALHAYSQQDEMTARRRFVKSEVRNKDANFFRNSLGRAILGRKAVQSFRGKWIR